MIPDLSVVIPAYNRVELLRHTLRSVARAVKDLAVEVIVVDDGSAEPLAAQLADLTGLAVSFIRQPNQGLIAAKNNGLQQARGEFVLCLDSDDLVHEDKFVVQVRRLREENADVCYTDFVKVNLNIADGSVTETAQDIHEVATRPEEFFLKVQPAPHNPIYRRSYLQKYLDKPLIPASPRYNWIGEVWIYYNLAIHPAKIVKVAGGYTICVASHGDEKISQNWEKLGSSSLALMLKFMELCPRTAETEEARRLVGECAFNAWRALPRRFNAAFETEILGVWRNAPKGPVRNLGGKQFQRLSRVLGAELAARILKYQRPRYAKIRTMNDRELNFLLTTSGLQRKPAL
jgi:Glycosyl transferase family 2